MSGVDPLELMVESRDGTVSHVVGKCVVGATRKTRIMCLRERVRRVGLRNICAVFSKVRY